MLDVVHAATGLLDAVVVEQGIEVGVPRLTDDLRDIRVAVARKLAKRRKGEVGLTDDVALAHHFENGMLDGFLCLWGHLLATIVAVL